VVAIVRCLLVSYKLLWFGRLEVSDLPFLMLRKELYYLFHKTVNKFSIYETRKGKKLGSHSYIDYIFFLKIVTLTVEKSCKITYFCHCMILKIV